MSYEYLFESIIRALDQEQAEQGEGTDGVQGPSQQGDADRQNQRKPGVRKLRKTPVKTTKDTAIGELIP